MITLTMELSKLEIKPAAFWRLIIYQKNDKKSVVDLMSSLMFVEDQHRFSIDSCVITPSVFAFQYLCNDRMMTYVNDRELTQVDSKKDHFMGLTVGSDYFRDESRRIVLANYTDKVFTTLKPKNRIISIQNGKNYSLRLKPGTARLKFKRA